MNRRTMFIAAGAAVLITIVWFVALWSPRKADLSEARQTRETVEAERDELSARVSRLKAEQKDEPMKLAKVATLKTAIPDEPNLAGFILDTNDAAVKAGIDWLSVSPSVPSPGAAAVAPAVAATPVSAGATAAAPVALALAPAEIKVNLQITGGYFQVLDFLNRLNDMPRLVVTDGLSVTSDEDAKLSVAVTGRLFLRAVPEAFGGPPAAPAVSPPTAAETNAPAPATPPTATAAPAANSTSGAKS